MVVLGAGVVAYVYRGTSLIREPLLMSEVPLHISKNPALVPCSRLVTRAL